MLGQTALIKEFIKKRRSPVHPSLLSSQRVPVIDTWLDLSQTFLFLQIICFVQLLWFVIERVYTGRPVSPDFPGFPVIPGIPGDPGGPYKYEQDSNTNENGNCNWTILV